MSERFWVKKDDGEFDGSLPGVPKKGYTADASAIEAMADVSNVKNEVGDKKAVNDELITDKQLVELLKMSKKGLSMGRQGDILHGLGINPALFTLEQVIAMVEMYAQLKKMHNAQQKVKDTNQQNKTNISNEGLDKFYHCRAHCIATRTGLGGIAASYPAGYAKEVYDLFKNALEKGTIHGRFHKRIVASIIDSIGDLAANSTGRLGDSRISCNDVCDDQWPKGVPKDIRDKVDAEFGK
ncbi:MAG: hypothetical protein L7F77_10815 [Candidatus Magnetominusculus sp. LBB02]|nr:hypothetical protein [Candidatus Magnetominusculus sp. LBB02]